MRCLYGEGDGFIKRPWRRRIIYPLNVTMSLPWRDRMSIKELPNGGVTHSLVHLNSGESKTWNEFPFSVVWHGRPNVELLHKVETYTENERWFIFGWSQTENSRRFFFLLLYWLAKTAGTSWKFVSRLDVKISTVEACKLFFPPKITQASRGGKCQLTEGRGKE